MVVYVWVLKSIDMLESLCCHEGFKRSAQLFTAGNALHFACYCEGCLSVHSLIDADLNKPQRKAQPV